MRDRLVGEGVGIGLYVDADFFVKVAGYGVYGGLGGGAVGSRRRVGYGVDG